MRAPRETTPRSDRYEEAGVSIGKGVLRASAAAGLLALPLSTLSGQTLEITNDQGVALSKTQVVNVGEHVRVSVRAQPPGTAITNIAWSVEGSHIRDWITKDGEVVTMRPVDYTGQAIHFLWRSTASCRKFWFFYLWCRTVRVTARIGGVTVSRSLRFRVERQAKAEKFYSDDLLMENHGNWHSVYIFSAASTRRGDLFLGWHRSQLEYFNAWRRYFGYPPAPYWNPVTAWTTTVPPRAKQHPSSPAPAPGFSTRHDLVTLELSAAPSLATASEGEYDLVTQAQGRGTTPEFVAAGYVLRTETVRQILCEDPLFPCTNPAFARNGTASAPTWWRPNTGQTQVDPWFSNGCPANPTPDDPSFVTTCATQFKRSFDDYSLRELGESIEGGIYSLDFQVNYHAFAHLAASGDMPNPFTSMRDPIFWAWHGHIDSVLTAWELTKGAEAQGFVIVYGKPTFSADWATLQVAFSNRTIVDLVRPGNVTVNGSPATTVTDVSLTGTGYIYAFSGFNVPPSGTVEAVIRREINNTIRTSVTAARPSPTLIMSTYGRLLTPPVNRYTYLKP